MNSKDWKILETLFEEKNITKAAERLYISQPAITYRLQQIEEEFGTKLVYRNRKGVKFTSEGEYLVRYAQKMLKELRKTKDHILNIGDDIRGTLRLGVSSNFAQYKLPKILKDFLDLYPHVQTNVRTGYSSEIAKLLYDDDVQVGIIRGEHNWYDHKHLIYQERYCVISQNEINVEDLPELPRINYKTDPLLKQTIENWWHLKFNKPPLIVMEVDKIEACREMAKHGLGYAIIPEICLTPDQDLITYDLTNENGKPLLRNTWLCYRESSLEFSVVKEFVRFVNDTTAKLYTLVP